MSIVLIVLNVGVWIASWYASYSNPKLLGLVLLAYGLGLRHAVDADHIAAVDNTTRKLMQDGQRPVAVGFFFSLGHSTIVIVLSVIVSLSASFLTTSFPQYKEIGAVIGTAVSSAFLLLIGLVNLSTFVTILKTWLSVVGRKTTHTHKEHTHVHLSGFLGKIFSPFLNAVTKSWHMYYVGLLFGLGFDTASEVSLLSLSAATGSAQVPLWHMLLLPISFTAAMALIDTLDGIVMIGAYGWAYINPIRKLYYNLNITFISVVIALGIGGIEAMQLIGEKLHLSGGFVSVVRDIDLSGAGYIIIAVFLLSWIVSMMFYRMKGYDRIQLDSEHIS